MGLFKRKKAKAEPVDPLAALGEGIRAALGPVLSQAPTSVAVAASEPDACRKWLAANPARGLALFSGSTRPWAGLFFPQNSFSGAGDEANARAEEFAKAWSASLPGAYRGSAACASSVPPGAQDAALWPFLEMEAFALDLGGLRAWLFAEPGLRSALSGAPAGDPSAPAMAAQAVLAVPNPHDFVALDSLVPRSFASGKYRFSAPCQSFGFLPGAQAADAIKAPGETAWYFAGFDVSGAAGAPPRKLTLIYAFDLGSMKSRSPEQDSGKVADALAVAAFHAAMAEFVAAAKCAPSNPGIKRIPAPPDLTKVGSVVFAKSTAAGAAFRMPFGVAAPSGAILPLLQAWLDPAEIKRCQSDPRGLILRLNARMLAAKLPGMLSPPELRKKAPQMLVSELLNHLSDGDYDLVLQNCLIAGMGAKGLPALFYYTESVTGEDGVVRERVAPLGPLDPGRLQLHMPEAFRDDYALNSGRLHANPATLCLSRNSEAMGEIAKAASSGRIAASARLGWLIKEFYLKQARAKDEAELAGLKSKGQPFAALGGIQQRQAQKAMARVDDREAAMALLASIERRDELRPFISKARMERLGEEIAYLERQREAEGLEPAQIVKAVRSIMGTCEAVREEEAREAQAALEREKARAAAPPPPEPKRRRR